MGAPYYLAKYIQNKYKASQRFDSGLWPGNAIRSANAALAPNGSLTADKLFTNSGTQEIYVTQNMDINSGDVMLKTVFAKPEEMNELSLLFYNTYFNDPSSTNLVALFDLTEGILTSVNTLILSTGIFPVYDTGWYFCYATARARSDAASVTTGQIRQQKTTTINTYDGMYIWQADLKVSEVLLPPIETPVEFNYPNLSEILAINPDYDYEEEDQKIEVVHRVKSGREYRYKFGDYGRTKFSVSYVNSEFKSICNSWWNNNADLRFVDQFGLEVMSCHLVNRKQPVGKPIKPYTNQFRGTIELETY